MSLLSNRKGVQKYNQDYGLHKLVVHSEDFLPVIVKVHIVAMIH